MARARLAMRLGHCGSILLLATGSILSCSKDPSRPLPPILHRTVTVAVEDSLTAPVANAAVTLVADFDSAGFAPIVRATTDAKGIASAVLAQGPWGAYALDERSAPRVAGATFAVPGATRPNTDTF